jgi:hypothetical protein
MSIPSARRRWLGAGGAPPLLSSWNVLLAGRFPDFDVTISMSKSARILTWVMA